MWGERERGGGGERERWRVREKERMNEKEKFFVHQNKTKHDHFLSPVMVSLLSLFNRYFLFIANVLCRITKADRIAGQAMLNKN